MRHAQIAYFFLLCSGRDGELPCLVVHARNRHVCDAPDTGVITHERHKLTSLFFFCVGLWVIPLRSGLPCLTWTPIDQMSTLTLGTAHQVSIQLRCTRASTAARKNKIGKKRRRKLTAVTMQPSNGLIEIDELSSRLRVSAKALRTTSQPSAQSITLAYARHRAAELPGPRCCGQARTTGIRMKEDHDETVGCCGRRH